MATDDALADAKAIGEDVEQLAVDAVPGLEAADDRDDYFDAVVADVVGPRTAPDIAFLGTCLLEPKTRVEIKAAAESVSNGARGIRPGRWYLKRGQHEQLLDEGATYLLVLYDGSGPTPELTELVVAPATIVDECVRGRWYDVDRREGQVAQLPWPQILGEGGVSA